MTQSGTKQSQNTVTAYFTRALHMLQLRIYYRLTFQSSRLHKPICQQKFALHIVSCSFLHRGIQIV